jgi:hypothetical protein
MATGSRWGGFISVHQREGSHPERRGLDNIGMIFYKNINLEPLVDVAFMYQQQCRIGANGVVWVSLFGKKKVGMFYGRLKN